MKDYGYAIKASTENGINFEQDFHELRSDAVDFLVELAKTYKYRKPRHANGSTGRYFFQLLKRLHDKSRLTTGMR